MMTKGEIEQFLESGWQTEATLYYNGYMYWFEGGWEYFEDNTRKFWYMIYKCKAEVFHENHLKRIFENGDFVGYEDIIDGDFDTEDEAKELMLKTEIFEGKRFWEIVNQLSWFEE